MVRRGRDVVQASARAAVVGWLITAVYYFYQYALRSAPAVMMPQLSDAFGLTAGGVASLAGLFYYGYSPFSLVAGLAMDRVGPRRVVPLGAAAVGVGAVMFASGNTTLAQAGRFLQGAGGVFALIGAAYIATTNFPPSRAATLIGATQMFGMAGGSAGQFLVGPIIGSGVSWSTFWLGMGIIGLVISGLLYALLPEPRASAATGPSTGAAQSFRIVFTNPQSILCGIIAGLIFIPTTIFDMVWGVRYLQDARGLDYASAVLRSATVPLGWMIGCPLLGFVSDRVRRRRPVIAGGALALLACLGWILYGPADVLPPYVLGLLAGVASGAAMLPYTVIKEANPPDVSGTATGVVNFINFTFSALLGPVFASLLLSASGGVTPMALEHYQSAFLPLLYGVALAIVLTIFLKETGPAAKAPVPTALAVTP
ncbi:MAG TPA: MFS transporter [Vicinamibacterales bacterium]|nr:MFS transporter [Vicinamibacterales bacterium]